MFTGLQKSLNQTLKSSGILKQSAPVVTTGSPADPIPILPAQLAKETAERFCEAVEMGNIDELKAIADALRARSGKFAGFGEKIR